MLINGLYCIRCGFSLFFVDLLNGIGWMNEMLNITTKIDSRMMWWMRSAHVIRVKDYRNWKNHFLIYVCAHSFDCLFICPVVFIWNSHTIADWGNANEWIVLFFFFDASNTKCRHSTCRWTGINFQLCFIVLSALWHSFISRLWMPDAKYIHCSNHSASRPSRYFSHSVVLLCQS